MSTGQGIFCLALGASTLLGGAALTIAVAPAAAALTAAAIAGSTLTAIGGSVAGNVTHSGLKASYAAVAKRLTSGIGAASLPENHDLIRALRRSQLDAIQYISASFLSEVRRNHAEGREYPESDFTKVHGIIKAYVKSEHDKTKKRDFPSDKRWIQTFSSESEEIEGRLTVENEVSAGQTVTWLADTASKAALDEIEAALKRKKLALQTAFLDWYEGKFGSAGFAYAAHQFFAERLKTDERLRTAVFSASFAGIERQGAAALEFLSRLDRQVLGMEHALSERFDALEEQIKALNVSNQLLDVQGYMDRLLDATAAGAKPDELRDIVRSALPHDNWISSTASHDVSRRIEELQYKRHSKDGPLMPAFFGRNDQLALLHDWIDSNDKGLAVVCAQSGGGKSALLARLCQERGKIGDTVIRHFVSLQMPSTTAPTSTLAHLLAQIRVIDRSDPKLDEMKIPSEERNLIDALHNRLKQPLPAGERMIIVIDALDEMDTAFVDTFVRPDLAPGNFVIVSNRTRADALTPQDLRRWMAAESAPGVKAVRFDIPGMKAAELLPWLEERIADLSLPDMKKVCERLEAVSEGVPLFLRYLIDVLIEDFETVTDRDDRLTMIAGLSDPFAGFLKVYLDGEPEHSDGANPVRTGRRAFTQPEKAFLAVLTQTLGPISELDVQAAMTFHFTRTRLESTVDVSKLDRLVTRWLSFRSADKDAPDQSIRISFDHPRLATEFAAALGEIRTRPALGSLIGWSQTAWQPVTDDILNDVKRGAEYPVWRLPQHFLKLEDIDKAAAVLMDIRFIEERFWSFDGRTASDLMVRDWTEWNRQNSERKRRASHD